MSAHPLIGKDLGNYTVKSILGEGGMGAVFLAEHKFLGDKVAIKVLHGSYANNPSVAQRFFQEAKSAREIGHPSIIEIKDFGQNEEGGLYLVMELLEGCSLADAIANGPLGEEKAARIGALIADGLAEAHKKGIVHRDLKPDNIFLVANDQIKILDFGIAKVLSSTANTGTGALLGTPMYMAPEQAKGAKLVGPHTDIYALGIIVFELLTGRTPFLGEGLAELLTKTLFEQPPKPSEFAPCSPEMEALLLQCLEKEPEKRPVDMFEMRDRMAARAGSGPIGISIAGPSAPRQTQSMKTKTTFSGTAGEKVEKGPAGGRSRSTMMVSAVAGLAVLVAGGAALMRFRGHAETPITAAATASATGAATGTAAPPSEKVSPPIPAAAPAPAAAPTAAPAPAVAAAPAAPAQQSVVLRTNPPGAKVIIDGKPAGTTPALLSLTLPHEVALSLDGYRATHEVVASPGETTIKLAPIRTARPAARSSAPAAHPAAAGEGLD